MTDATPADRPVDSEAKGKTSGWERADALAHGAGKAISGTATVLTKGWGIVLIIAAIIVIVVNPGALLIPGLLVIAYGVYLVLPGSKFVIW